ncbi:hypothetical protein HYFRA_00011561 [Hymenoscyphus fraxineus]|uniref:NADP-dependent oxidoreductase domain-containing protein n=1 Tax=Hymenoscyphus fraxineus TaxID=746836 RepID=A0A9N9PXC3_9HELO|nr:hypothetical protein HYFRA_00011561 [Hymenoscyphus fraxineus]
MPQLLGKEVGPIGYGMMGLSWRPQPQPLADSIKALKIALDSGCNFWNGGILYGTPEYNSLHIIKAYFKQYPEDASRVILSIKGGVEANLHPNGDPEFVKKNIDDALVVLDGTKKIDIFECARVDKRVPVEVTLKALEEYVQAGKIGGISLSEVSAETVKRAVKVTKIVACEVELSLWSLDIFENGVAAACAEHDIPVVAYSPIGRGILSGEIKKPEDIPEGDFRRMLPRFQPDTFPKNLELVHKIQDIATSKGVTPAQLAISWVVHQSKKNGNPVIIPIPGATTESRILENVKSKDVVLSESDVAAIDEILKGFTPTGGRYGGPGAVHMNG